MKKIFLPNLEKILVNNYSLYSQEPTFEFTFCNGINAVVGANGIGKTTFVNMIIYCLVGHRKKMNKQKKNSKKPEFEYIDEDFFSSRMDYKFGGESNENAFVELKFFLGENHIEISRSLYKNKILSILVNNELIELANDEQYNDIISKYSGITNFEDFEIIVREFLFFDEQRRNIAWEVNTQDDILRILLLEEQYHLKFKELEECITREDSKGRHESENKRMAEKSYKELVKEKENIVNNLDNIAPENVQQLDRSKLIMKKNIIQSNIEDIQGKLEEKQEEFDKKIYESNKVEGELTSAISKFDIICSEIKKIETLLYKSIYEKFPDYYYTIEKNMLSEGKCLICNSKSNIIRENAIIRKKNNECLICSSKINVNDINSDEQIVKLNMLNKEKQMQENTIANIKLKVNQINQSIQTLQSEIKNSKNTLEEQKHALIIINSEIDKNDVSEEGDVYNEILRTREKLIDELNKKIKEAYKQRDEYKKELLFYSKKFKNMISNLNSSLSQYFNKYASTFIGMDCELAVSEKKINNIPHITYVPKINNQERRDIWSVSESQRFFLDQAFRMAIIDYLQNNITNFSTFFITETPEGSLDIAYESQVAEMFWKFAESNNKIIFTSNLNSSTFLKEVFQNISKEDRKKRMLNLLEKGNMTRVQENKKEKLYDILQIILED